MLFELSRFAVVLGIIQPPVFGADEQVGHAVLVPIDNGWAGCVAGDVSLVEQSPILQNDFAVALTEIRTRSQKVWNKLVGQLYPESLLVEVKETVKKTRGN